MRFDIHVHSFLSPCSKLDIRDIVKHAKTLGLDGVCITDHDSMNIQQYLQEGIQGNGLCVIFGMEYATPEGDFLLFGPFADIIPDLPAKQLLKLVQQKDGVAVAAHPFRVDRPIPEYIVREGLCRIIESLNGRNTDIENLQIEIWRRKYTLTECGGSDAHQLNELGSGVTHFEIPIQTREDFIDALKKGKCKPELISTAQSNKQTR